MVISASTISLNNTGFGPSAQPAGVVPSFFVIRAFRPAMTADAQPGEFENALGPSWRLAQAGDEAAYRRSLSLIAARLRGYLRRRLSAYPDDVEDLVQETLLAIHLQRGSHDEGVPVSAWVLAIARHKWVDLWRRKGRSDHLTDVIDDVDEGELIAPSDGSEARRDLHRLLQELPQAQRQALELTKLEGLSVADAAARTGASESAIKVQVHRGLKRLADLVRRESHG